MSYRPPLFSIPVATPTPSKTETAARGEATKTHLKRLCIHTTGAFAALRQSKAPAKTYGMLPMLPKPLGVMTYAEMSAEIASLFFKNTVLETEAKRLAGENATLKRRNRSAEREVKQNRGFYDGEVARLTTELRRLRQFSDSIVGTL